MTAEAMRTRRGRCEVCDEVIEPRPVPERRRCAEDLDQLDLLDLLSRAPRESAHAS